MFGLQVLTGNSSILKYEKKLKILFILTKVQNVYGRMLTNYTCHIFYTYGQNTLLRALYIHAKNELVKLTTWEILKKCPFFTEYPNAPLVKA